MISSSMAHSMIRIFKDFFGAWFHHLWHTIWLKYSKTFWQRCHYTKTAVLNGVVFRLSGSAALKKKHINVAEITPWAQEHLWKICSVNKSLLQAQTHLWTLLFNKSTTNRDEAELIYDGLRWSGKQPHGLSNQKLETMDAIVREGWPRTA